MYDAPIFVYDVSGYKFTGKERDAETGCDYFGARYYCSNMGRFMTPDWSESPEPVPYADFSDPQTLNLYGYVANRPVTNADVDGHCGAICAGALAGASIGAVQVLYKTGQAYFNGKGEIPTTKEALATIGRGALVGAVSAATVGGGAGTLYGAVESGFAVGSANVVGGVAERAASNDPKTKALDVGSVGTDAVAGFAGGAAGAKISKALEPVVQKLGGGFADNITRSITPAAKGVNQLGVDATVKAQSLAASATRATVTSTTTGILGTEKKPPTTRK